MIDKVKSSPFKLIWEIINSNPKIIFKYVAGLHGKVYEDEKILILLKKGISFVRWGDGETAIARGKFAWYQKYDPNLSLYLQRLVSNPPKEIIFGLPWAVIAKPFDKRWNLRIFKIIFSTRIFLIKNLTRKHVDMIYLSTLDFWWRHSMELSSLLDSLFSERECILIASQADYLKFCPKGTSLIPIPKINAFEEYQNILNLIKTKKVLSKGRIVLFCAAGPTTKALLLDLNDKFQIVDIGHGFNFALYGKNTWAWSENKH